MRFLIILVILIVPFSLAAQPAGNEWINFDQQYYKFSVAQDGVYKITYNALSASTFPVNSVDPRSIQIFGRGVEQYIYVKGQGDGVFNTDDFIEVYCAGSAKSKLQHVQRYGNLLYYLEFFY
jgi:hypothetical protein